METQAPTIEEAIEAVTCGCVGCISIPLSVLALELAPPLSGWAGMLEQEGIRVTTDAVGRDVISIVSARRLLANARRQKEKAVEDHARRSAAVAAKQHRAGPGIPAPPGTSRDVTALEIMMAHDQKRVER